MVDVHVALEYHLTSNHFPPISRIFVPVARQAIAHADDCDHKVTMPNGITLTAGEIIEQLHLDWFIDTDE